MKIRKQKVNHIENPVGYDFSSQTFTWNYEAEEGTPEVEETRVLVSEKEDFSEIFWDSGWKKEFFKREAKLKLKSRTRYFWKVEAKVDGKTETSTPAFFETGKMEEPWVGKWLGLDGKDRGGILVRKTFEVKGTVKKARAYMTGLGLYECYLNGKLQNDGFLAPGFDNYHFWIQYQTLDLTGSLFPGTNVLGFLLGAGWYRGRFGVNGGFENNFGSKDHLLVELHLEYEDGREEVIGSDESFRMSEGPLRFSNIYDGEIYDASYEYADRTGSDQDWLMPGFDDSLWKSMPLCTPEKMEKLTERFSLPVVRKEIRKPAALLTDPEGKKILDMGQNMTGWLVFRDGLKKGDTITLRYAEHMEDGRINRKNLLTAKAEFVYTSNGEACLVRPHFTYYGFRYVQLEGFPENVKKEDFEGWCLYSDMETIGEAETGKALVNRLIQNAYWSQRDNFLEHPTDCPQRAERLGWTGDAQMYCQTAAYFMDTTAFFRKYMKDVNEEQRHKKGLVPFIVPKINAPGFENMEKQEECSAAWSDVATIIPWSLYRNSGDKNLLAEEYEGMKAWVEYMRRKDEEAGGKGLWQSGFHFGDWLALDNPQPGPFGKTDPYYIASCYYFYSTMLLEKAASVLGKTEDAAVYGALKEKIRAAIRREYLDENGICKQGTQTGYILAIYLDLPDEKQGGGIRENGRKLVEKIQENQGHLDTGFVGTSYICTALTKAGFQKEAVELLLQEGYPGWLYQVKKGATTIWEAWDALDENGRMKRDASLNHYAFGSVVGWIFSDVCGICPMEEAPGYEKVLFAPHPDPALGFARAKVDSLAGTYELSWSCEENGSLRVKASVPYMGEARLSIGTKEQRLKAGTYEWLLDKNVWNRTC